MSGLQTATQTFERFKGAFNSGDLQNAGSLLSNLKVMLLTMPSMPPMLEQTPSARDELLFARSVLEHAAILSLKQQDDDAMERAFAQLKTFYSDTRHILPDSSEEVSFTGINLLRLLVQNRIAEFHTELELVTAEALQTPAIQQPIQLEQWLMEGAYNKVLGAAASASGSVMQAALMARLSSTVRDEVASCSEKAYAHLRVGDAKKMMMFDSDMAVLDYASEHEWRVEGDTIFFQQAASTAAKTLPAIQVINDTLVYARELERIV